MYRHTHRKPQNLFILSHTHTHNLNLQYVHMTGENFINTSHHNSLRWTADNHVVTKCNMTGRNSTNTVCPSGSAAWFMWPSLLPLMWLLHKTTSTWTWRTSTNTPTVCCIWWLMKRAYTPRLLVSNSSCREKQTNKQKKPKTFLFSEPFSAATISPTGVVTESPSVTAPTTITVTTTGASTRAGTATTFTSSAANISGLSEEMKRSPRLGCDGLTLLVESY